MRYMREQLGHEIDTERMGSRRMSRQRFTPKKPPKPPRDIPIVVPFLAVTPDSNVFLAIPDTCDDTMPAPDTRWHPSQPLQLTAQDPDALAPAAASSSLPQGSLSGSRRAREVLGLSPRVTSNTHGDTVGDLPEGLPWTCSSLDTSVVPWWCETFGEKRAQDDASATSRLKRLFTQQQHSISQLEKALANMLGSPPTGQRASTSPLVRSQSSCSLQQHRAPSSFTVVGRRAFSNSNSPRAPASPPPLHPQRGSLQQEVIVEVSNEIPRSSGELHTAHSRTCTIPGHSTSEVLEES